MTAPDDVRARFEAAWNRSIYSHCAVPNESFKEIAEQFYRAAHADLSGEVRELVEADREYDEAVEAVLTHQIGDLEAVQERMAVASERRAAALAKFHPTHQETK